MFTGLERRRSETGRGDVEDDRWVDGGRGEENIRSKSIEIEKKGFELRVYYAETPNKP